MNFPIATILRLAGALALAAGAAAFAPARAAEVELITGTDYDKIIAAFENADFSVEQSEDDDGDPLMKSTDDDEPFTVHFYRCNEDHECDAIQLVSGWNLDDGISLQKLSQWNHNKVWGQAYRDDNNDPWIAYAINLKGGVTVENFEDSVAGWRNIMRDFEEHIGWSN